MVARLVFMLLLIPSIALANTQSIAVLSSFSGKVIIKNKGKWGVAPVKGLRIHSGDKVVTQKGAATLVFDDESKMDIGTYSNVTVVQRTMDTDRHVDRRLRLLVGKAKYEQKHDPTRKTTLVSPTAVAALRGSKADVVTDGRDQTWFRQTEGTSDKIGDLNQDDPLPESDPAWASRSRVQQLSLDAERAAREARSQERDLQPAGPDTPQALQASTRRFQLGIVSQQRSVDQIEAEGSLLGSHPDPDVALPARGYVTSAQNARQGLQNRQGQIAETMNTLQRAQAEIAASGAVAQQEIITGLIGTVGQNRLQTEGSGAELTAQGVEATFRLDPPENVNRIQESEQRFDQLSEAMKGHLSLIEKASLELAGGKLTQAEQEAAGLSLQIVTSTSSAFKNAATALVASGATVAGGDGASINRAGFYAERALRQAEKANEVLTLAQQAGQKASSDDATEQAVALNVLRGAAAASKTSETVSKTYAVAATTETIPNASREAVEQLVQEAGQAEGLVDAIIASSQTALAENDLESAQAAQQQAQSNLDAIEETVTPEVERIETDLEMQKQQQEATEDADDADEKLEEGVQNEADPNEQIEGPQEPETPDFDDDFDDDDDDDEYETPTSPSA